MNTKTTATRKPATRKPATRKPAAKKVETTKPVVEAKKAAPAKLVVKSFVRTSNPTPNGINTMIAGYFTQPATIDAVIAKIMASDWTPPKSRLFKNDAEKVAYLKGYTTYLAGRKMIEEFVQAK